MAAMVCAAALALGGCADQDMEWQAAALPTQDYQLACQAAQAVLSEEYVLEKASFTEGVFVTRPLLVQKTGKERQLGAYISSGAVQNFRRTVRAEVDRGTDNVVVRVNAALERESTPQAETLAVGTEGGDRRQAGAEREYKYVEGYRSAYWAPVGRDTAAEQDLLARIQAKLQEMVGGEMKLPAAEPEDGTKPDGPAKGGTTGEDLRREVEQYK